MLLESSIRGSVLDVCLNHKEEEAFRFLVDRLYPAIYELPEYLAVNMMFAAGNEMRTSLPRLAQVLDEFSTHRSWKVLVIRHQLDESDIGATPDRYLGPGENPLVPPDIYRGVILGLAGWYGYGYTSQQGGVIHNNVVAIADSFGVVGISANPLDELGLHTEDASYNLGEGRNISPDFLTLHFLRNHQQIPSVVSFLPDWKQLSRQSRKVLETEFFRNKTNPGQAASDSPAKVSVVYGPDDDPFFRINAAKLDTSGYTAEQAAALCELVTLLNRNAVDLPLQGGDIALIDNRRVAHGRRQYTAEQMPRFDGRDRWQRRLVAVSDPSRIQPFEASPRVVDPAKLFAAFG